MSPAIVNITASESAVSREMTGKLVTPLRSLQESQKDDKASFDRAPCSNVSPREEENLGRIAKGRTNKEIARAMNIAETTVKARVQHIPRKRKLGSRVQAATHVVARAF
ncbi:hypothetical protein A6V36_28735 [Paraburkholderia ginsengiterrae]|uniref:HTH luxR-type domain-containing protein n=2 Tax=Paraburkholderia ginsengiterrae TaxID=1462993 RepID=A0A1A9MZ39_9BURK|nr:hypothetical protein A6V37_08880 [Paraburkholderia ginsengiterrae]OAJ59041.1 hypothetical protein A6V36_28735 [Paraburkholderia ginsengiterrae]